MPQRAYKEIANEWLDAFHPSQPNSVRRHRWCRPKVFDFQDEDERISWDRIAEEVAEIRGNGGTPYIPSE